MYCRFQLPRKCREGWDNIIYISNSKNISNLVNIFTPSVDFDQDNPHHNLTLDKHLIKAARYIEEHYNEYGLDRMSMAIVYIATLYHDIGKPFVKTYKLWSGKTSDYAHYYNHAEVGAYMIACLLNRVPTEDYEKWLTIMHLIQCHMDGFSSRKFLEDAEEEYGKDFRIMLELLHVADTSAH